MCRAGLRLPRPDHDRDDDRLFPTGFLRRVARERLGITPDEIDGGHTPELSRPHELVEPLDAYAAEQGLLGGHPPGITGPASSRTFPYAQDSRRSPAN